MKACWFINLYQTKNDELLVALEEAEEIIKENKSGLVSCTEAASIIVEKLQERLNAVLDLADVDIPYSQQANEEGR